MDLPKNSIPQLKRMSNILSALSIFGIGGLLLIQLCCLGYCWIAYSYFNNRFYQNDIIPASIILLVLAIFQVIVLQLWFSARNFSKYLKTLDAQLLNKGFKHLRWFWLSLGLVFLSIAFLVLTAILLEELNV